MQSTVEFQICYPNTNEELGLTLDTLGKFVIVTQCSSQSEEYGLRYQDRIIKVQGINCVDRIPSDVVNYIRRYHNQNLTITFQRSFKPEEMDSINKSISAPLQNDSVFFDGSFLFRTGLYSSLPFTEKVIRIMRITGPLLPLANKLSLIPYGIALMWYQPSSSPIPYAATPLGALNLLPCLLDVRSGTNGFFVLHFDCSLDVLLTSKEKKDMLNIIETMTHLFKRDLSHLIKAISNSSSGPKETSKPAEEEEENPMQTIDFGETENSMTTRNLHSTLNIPYPLKIMDYILQLYRNELVRGLHGLKAHLSDLIATGFHPEQVVHSLTALFFHCRHTLPPEAWDSDVRRDVQDIIVEVAKHNADYIRTTSAQPSGFYVFNCGDKDMEGLYMMTRETFGDLPIFIMKNGARLFRQIHQGRSTWILQKKGENSAVYYIHSTEVIPPRFNWVS
ncbi:hypothetical protein WA577_000679, partial [Blastocystis sp. JDR]